MTTPRQIVQLERLFDPQTVDLACHAALPVALTPDLLHAIRVNFFLDVEQPVPFWAEARLLLSPLCHAIGDGLYQIDPPVRDELLRLLTARHGEVRLRALAELLLQFGEHGTPWADRPELDSAQRLSALAVLEPEAARAWLGDPSARPRGQELDEAWFVAMRGQIEGPSTAVPETGQNLDETVPVAIDAASRLLERGELDNARAVAESAVALARKHLDEVRTSSRADRLTPAERQAVGEAIRAAFPTIMQLEMLLSDGLDVELDEITSRFISLAANVADVVRWADERDLVRDLMSAARRERPDRPDLVQILDSLDHRRPAGMPDQEDEGRRVRAAAEMLALAIDVLARVRLARGAPGEVQGEATPATTASESPASSQANGTTASSSTTSVEEGVNATIRRVGRREGDAKIVALAREYDDIRARMPFNDERTRRLEDVRERIQSAGVPSPVLQSRLRSSRSAGERLALVCLLEKQPDDEMLDWLADRFAGEQPFVQFWAARAFESAARLLPADQVIRLRAAIDRAGQGVWDAPARAVLDRAAAMVAEAITTEAAAPTDHTAPQTPGAAVGRRLVREVMTPRPDVIAIQADATVDALRQLVRGEQYSRLPVYTDSLDNITGLIVMNDLMQMTGPEAGRRKVREFVQPVLFVPETAPVADVARAFQQQRAQMAIVVDEYGGTAGLVTVGNIAWAMGRDLRDDDEAEGDAIDDVITDAPTETADLMASRSQAADAGGSTVAAVMTPRPDIIAIEADTTIDALRELIRGGQYARLPVYADSLDNITGFIVVNDLMQVAGSEAGPRKVREFVQPILFVPETMLVIDAVRQFQQKRVPMAIVVDEYGATAGLVTVGNLTGAMGRDLRDEEMPSSAAEGASFPREAGRISNDEQRLAEPIVTDWKLWPAGSRIRVLFLDGEAALQARVFSVAQEWTTHTDVTLLRVTSGEADIRISFSLDGSWSALGTEALDRERYPLDKPTMNYGWLTDGLPDADVRHVVLHEFGTALGLINEHQSPNCPLAWNVPEIVRDLTGPPNNFTREATIDLFRKYQFTGSPDYRPFDPTSVMMWPLASSWIQDGQSFAQSPTLSASDSQFIARLYSRGVSA